MGQYFEIANLDKKERISPHRFGDGAKLLEFGASGSGTMTGLAFLLRKSTGTGGGDVPQEALENFDDVVGRWAGDRVAIVGDYDESDIGQRVWAEDTDFEDISQRVKEAMKTDDYLKKNLREDLKEVL